MKDEFVILDRLTVGEREYQKAMRRYNKHVAKQNKMAARWRRKNRVE